MTLQSSNLSKGLFHHQNNFKSRKVQVRIVKEVIKRKLRKSQRVAAILRKI
jgi:hypothetical protein